MFVTIVSPEKELFKGETQCIHIPGKQGRFEVLENHAALISTLVEGDVKCVGAETFEIHIKGGFVEIMNNKVSICVEL